MLRLIKTIEELKSFLENENGSNQIIEMANLFVTAIHDWPSTDLNEIKQFKDDFNRYFGEALSINRLNQKNFSGINAWNLESSSSIIQMVKLNKKDNDTFSLDEYHEIISNYFYLNKEDHTDSKN